MKLDDGNKIDYLIIENFIESMFNSPPRYTTQQNVVLGGYLGVFAFLGAMLPGGVIMSVGDWYNTIALRKQKSESLDDYLFGKSAEKVIFDKLLDTR